MCTVVLLFGLLPGYPLVLAANRDEFITRHSSRPYRWQPEPGAPAIYAGRDELKGGTWLGINQHGVLAGIVNRTTGQRDPEKVSRGSLVIRCLCEKTLEGIERLLAGEDLSRYNPFTLFSYAGGRALMATNHPSREIWPLEAGIHIITNCDPRDRADSKKAYLLKTYLSPLPEEPGVLRARLVSLCRDHEEPQGFPFPACVHLEGYGTVSSAIAWIAERWEESRFEYCEGPPCQGSYLDLTGEFVSIFS